MAGQFGLWFRLPRKSQDSLTCRKSATWDRRLYFPSEGRHAVDFFTRKILRLRPSLNLRFWVPEASMLTTRPPKPLYLWHNTHARELCLPRWPPGRVDSYISTRTLKKRVAITFLVKQSSTVYLPALIICYRYKHCVFSKPRRKLLSWCSVGGKGNFTL
jgi:hypothetical protein